MTAPSLSVEEWTDEKYINTLSGYCCYTLMKDYSRAVIYNLYVYPEYRRQGEARKILQSVINEIRNIYKGEIEIQVSPRENSITQKALTSFYRSLELKVLGELKNDQPE